LVAANHRLAFNLDAALRDIRSAQMIEQNRADIAVLGGEASSAVLIADDEDRHDIQAFSSGKKLSRNTFMPPSSAAAWMIYAANKASAQAQNAPALQANPATTILLIHGDNPPRSAYLQAKMKRR
jgi:hypothetical protein